MRKVVNDFSVFLGDDLEEDILKPYCFVFSRFHTKSNHAGSVGVVGPLRLKYDRIVPTVKYFGSLVDEIAGW